MSGRFVRGLEAEAKFTRTCGDDCYRNDECAGRVRLVVEPADFINESLFVDCTGRALSKFRTLIYRADLRDPRRVEEGIEVSRKDASRVVAQIVLVKLQCGLFAFEQARRCFAPCVQNLRPNLN